uniref:Ionotropic glutamate receptor C-terminal domain-containing protein n=1 Tax=Odontella aurita TaxID=265563 RepID=A0A7S4K5Y0_9STRA
MCVAAYTITAKRASVTSFFETSDDSVYLIVLSDDGGSGIDWETFKTSFFTVFRPFTYGSWLMIMVFVLPVLGLLMFYHERGATGSAYTDVSPVMVKQRETGEVHFEVRRIPTWKHVINSVYMGILAFFQESYDQSVVTWGGKINLLAISSFVLLVLNVYTANLAAILTEDITQGEVTSIESAVKAGYNFCAERKMAETVMDLHDISPDMIVPDPEDLGGDGKAGFNCPNCKARTRVFDYMKPNHDDGSVYCDAALTSWEDLQVLQASGQHCDKARVGEALVTKSSGIPIYDGVSAELTALLYTIKNDGVLAQALNAAEPTSQCPAKEESTNSLSIQQLTGIWCFSFFFAGVALVVKLVQAVHSWRQGKVTTGIRVRPLQRYDQWGNATCHDIIIDGRLYDPDAVRELHEASSSGSQNDETMDGGGHDSSDDIMGIGRTENAAVCKKGASILQGSFNSWN